MKSNILRLTILCATLSLPLFTTTSCEIEDKINANTDSILALIDSVTELKNQLNSLKEDHDKKIQELTNKHIKEIDELNNLIIQNQNTLSSLKEEYDNKISSLEDEDNNIKQSISSLSEEYKETVNSLNKEITANKEKIDNLTREYNAKVSELESKASELNEQLSTLRSEYENKVEEIENSISSLNSSLSEVDKKYQDEIKRIEDDYNEKIDSLKSDYDTKLASVNEALASLTEKDKEIIERLTTLEEQVAKLLEINTYTVTFDPNNGQSSFTQIVNEYSLIEKPISPTLTGYTFVSWVDEYDDPWFFGQSLVVKDITLRAKYVGNTYKITLDANGGTCNDDYVLVTYNSSYSLPKAFKDGFTFRGWTYNDEDVIDTTSYQFTNDVTYVARYSRPYSVSFDSNGGSFVESITYDDWIIDNLPTPTKEGFRFGGWYIGTTKIENGYKNIEQVDLTLKASWINAASLFEYQEIDDEVTILKYVGTYTDVEIPSTIEEKNVTSIDVNAFKNNLNLTSVKFNRNLTSIPDGLLEGQENIKTLGIFIDINTTLRKLFNASNQTKLPTSIENIEYSYIDTNSYSNDWSSFFNGVTKAYNFTIPYNGSNNLPSFTDCVNLKTLSYPTGYNLMYDYAFQGCTNLTSINIPEAVTSIGYSAFYGCSSLISINIPESVISIGENAFSACSSLTLINIPEGVTSIDNHAFNGCSSLTSINIPEYVTSVGEYAFRYCSSLTSINIPESVTSIGEHAFEECYNVTIYYEGTRDQWNELVNGKYIGSYNSVICSDETI